MSSGWRRNPFVQELRTPRQVLYRHRLRLAGDEVAVVPQLDRVDGVSSKFAASPGVARFECRVPVKRCVVSCAVASAYGPIVPRSMLRGRFRNIRRAAAARKVSRIAERLAEIPPPVGAGQSGLGPVATRISVAVSGPAVSRH